MNISITLVSVGVAIAAMVIVTVAVSAGVRRAPSTATHRATKVDVLFVVSTGSRQRHAHHRVGVRHRGASRPRNP